MIFDDDEEFPVSVPIADDLRRLQQQNAALLKQSSEWEGKALERFVRIEELESENARLTAEVANLRKSLDSLRCPGPQHGVLSYASLRQLNIDLWRTQTETAVALSKARDERDKAWADYATLQKRLTEAENVAAFQSDTREEHATEIASLKMRLDDAFAIAEKYRQRLAEAEAILRSAPELNMANYSEDQVTALNAAANEAYRVLQGREAAEKGGDDDSTT